MKSKKVMRYYCDHCSRGHWKKDACLEHEKRCYFNPNIRACGTCRDFEQSGTDNNGMDGRERHVWTLEPWCNHFEKELHVKLPKETDEKMRYKTKCTNWKSKTK